MPTEKEDAKRKRDDEEEDDDDDAPVKKKPENETPVLKKEKGGDGDSYFANLGTKEFKNNKTQKRVTVSKFKGHVNVQLREYYEKDGKMLPGKSGLSLSKDQFNSVLALADQIQAAIKDLE